MEFNDDEIRNILKDALKVKLEEKQKRPYKVEINSALVSTIGEFMACFRLMGYDLDGNPVNMVVHREKIQKAALDNLFMVEIGKFMSEKN